MHITYNSLCCNTILFLDLIRLNNFMEFIGAFKEVEADFIRLLWEQNVPLVVMVTKLMEGTAVSVTQFFEHIH